MTPRAALAGLALALSAAAATQAQAAGPTYAIDLTLNYFSPAEPPPDPDFQGSFLTGQAQFFYQVVSTFNSPLLPPGPPVDIARLGVGDSFTIHFVPPGPCFVGGACNLFFKFGGAAAGFGAEACPPGPPDVNACPPGPPVDNLNLLPAVQFGVFDANGLPAVQTGPIFAFDAPVQVGDWRTAVSFIDVPEPAAWGLLLLGLTMTGGAMRRRRGAAAA
jgi:hypothetical protein